MGTLLQSWLPLIVALVLNGLANVLMKVGAKIAVPLGPEATLFTKVTNFLNWATLLGIFFFAANVLAYRKALDRLDISVAYPIMVSGSLILIVLAAAWLPVLRERIVLTQLGGMLLIAAGVWLVSRPA
ncbi:MAG: hypothetical protein RBU45_17420 [Myxococcota bacterium]|jgi:multidrug transporter EmrE-like cation transporter|nr:hypothetical protein [Myxococcota bacterium]